MRIRFGQLGLGSILAFALGAVWLAAIPAHAQQPAPAAANPAPPSAAALTAARGLVVASGMARSFGAVIPQFMDQIGKALTQTRPELIPDLNEVLTRLQPEFDKQSDEMVGGAAQIYAKLMSEADLTAALAFFQSPAGKQYVATQPAFLTEVVAAMKGWQGRISTDMMTRVRAEMKKKGHDV